MLSRSGYRTSNELDIARAQGEYVARIAAKLAVSDVETDSARAHRRAS